MEQTLRIANEEEARTIRRVLRWLAAIGTAGEQKTARRLLARVNRQQKNGTRRASRDV